MLQDFYYYASIVQTILVAISLIFIWREVRENTRLARAANVQSLVELSSPLNLQLVQDRKLAEFWVLGPEKFKEMDRVDKYRYRSLISWWLILHENIYYQHEKKLLDNSAYAAWEGDLEEFVLNQRVEELMNESDFFLQKEFAHHLRTLIAKKNSKTAVSQTKP